MRAYAAQTLPGLEMIALDEIRQRVPGVSLRGRAHGLILFEAEGPALPLLELRTTEDVFAVIGETRSLDSSWQGLKQIRDGLLLAPAIQDAVNVYHELHRHRVKRITFRVVAQKSGSHAFRRVDAQEQAVRAVVTRFSRWKPVAEHAHVEIWLNIQGRLAVTMLRLSDRTMRHRAYKREHIPASLRPTMAAAMVLLSGADDRDVFVDAMCGAGTIPLERRAAGKARAILGGDISEEALQAAYANAAQQHSVGIFRWDATRLPLPGQSVTKVVTNLPFGKQIGTGQDVAGLYRAFLPELARVLAPNGRAVLLTSEGDLPASLVVASGLRQRRMLPVSVLGQHASIYVLARAQAR